MIFDWYGTRAKHSSARNYESVLSEFGYEVGEDVISAYLRRWYGVDHRVGHASEEPRRYAPGVGASRAVPPR